MAGCLLRIVAFFLFAVSNLCVADGCLRLVIDCRLFVDLWLLVACCLLHVVCCMLLAVCRVLRVVVFSCLLILLCNVLFVDRNCLFVVGCLCCNLLIVQCCLLFVGC